jgi:hypothetical protein
MPYTPGSWIETVTVIHKADMDRIEAGVAASTARADDETITGKWAFASGVDGTIVTGSGAPQDRSVLDPTDGTWGWSAAMGLWIGPAYEVSWQVGDNVGRPTWTAGEFDLLTSELVGGTPLATQQATSGDYPQWGSAGGGSGGAAVNAGTGIVYLIEIEDGFGGPTAPPQPDLNPLDYLGDLVLTNGTTPVPWTEEPGSGEDGTLWRDTISGLFYGPRTSGAWGVSLGALFDPSTFHVLTNTIIFAPTDPLAAGVVINAGTEPADNYMSTGEVALWYEDTTGAPVLHAKAIDAVGTVFDLQMATDVVLKSPNDTQYRIVVANDGTLSTVAV